MNNQSNGHGLRDRAPQTNDEFLALKPVLERHAAIWFRNLPAVHREEAIAEALAAAFVSFVRLKAQGKDPVRAFPSRMAAFGVLHVRSGRHVGNAASSKDVLSLKAQRRHGFQLKSLDDLRHSRAEGWQEALRDNRVTPIPDQVAFRIDFGTFLRSLIERDRRLIEFLAVGNSGKQAADRFNLTQGRITQLRRQWCREWYALHGEKAPFEERVQGRHAPPLEKHVPRRNGHTPLAPDDSAEQPKG